MDIARPDLRRGELHGHAVLLRDVGDLQDDSDRRRGDRSARDNADPEPPDPTVSRAHGARLRVVGLGGGRVVPDPSRRRRDILRTRTRKRPPDRRGTLHGHIVQIPRHTLSIQRRQIGKGHVPGRPSAEIPPSQLRLVGRRPALRCPIDPHLSPPELRVELLGPFRRGCLPIVPPRPQPRGGCGGEDVVVGGVAMAEPGVDVQRPDPDETALCCHGQVAVAQRPRRAADIADRETTHRRRDVRGGGRVEQRVRDDGLEVDLRRPCPGPVEIGQVHQPLMRQEDGVGHITSGAEVGEGGAQVCRKPMPDALRRSSRCGVRGMEAERHLAA